MRAVAKVRPSVQNMAFAVWRITKGLNALAESIIGLCKTELVHNRGRRRGLDDFEYATLEWVDWFSHHRILEPIGDIPPAEHETNYYCQHKSRQPAATQ